MYTLELDKPRCTLTLSRPLEGSPRVAIIGSRKSEPEYLVYAKDLAREIVKAGGIVVSGGAQGADTAAHEGALAAGGRTWVIAPTGKNHVFPRSNKGLFREVEASAGAMVWPFPADKKADRGYTFHTRNDVLVALSDAVVVVQAITCHSGAFLTANKTLQAGKPLWVVPPVPWSSDRTASNPFEGSVALVRRPGVKVLWRTRDLLASVGLATPDVTIREDPKEQLVMNALANPQYRDSLSERTGLTIRELSMVLFQLQMEGAVREMLDGRIERLG